MFNNLDVQKLIELLLVLTYNTGVLSIFTYLVVKKDYSPLIYLLALIFIITKVA